MIDEPLYNNESKKPDAKYWEHEAPQIKSTGKNVLRYYEQAGKLQVALPDYYNYKGEQRPGKLGALDLDALEEDPQTLQWLIAILQGRVWEK